MAPSPFLLDTNAYVLFFQNPRTDAYDRLAQLLATDSGISFYIPEIVSMEVQSVLGRYRRGGNRAQREACERHIITEDQVAKCQHTCVFPEQRRMRPKVFRALQRMIHDIETQRGQIQATVLPLNVEDIAKARMLLLEFADRFSFNSHDSLVAGSLLTSKRRGLALTLITSDRGLKAVMKEQRLRVLDPREL